MNPHETVREALTTDGEFVARHIGPDEQDIRKMLSILELESIEELLQEAVPETIRTDHQHQLPVARSESRTLDALRAMAAENLVLVSMIGQGYYGTFTPGVILRNVLENPGWYTAYTPYQAEVSQGRLEALLNFQQMVMDLTGMELANASLLDEATAAAEAMAMSRRIAKAKSKRFFVDADCHPQTLAVLRTRAVPLGIELQIGDLRTDLRSDEVFGAYGQYPTSTGEVFDWTEAANGLHEQGALLTVGSDLLALCALRPPGEMGADIVVGSAQRFGVPMGYGGPHAAFFATRDAFKRSTPGRIIGVSVDTRDRPALRMALQTREQHIRREKATSNICTAQVLLANIAGLYAVYHGPTGLAGIARRVHTLAKLLRAGLDDLGIPVRHDQFFDTVALVVPGRADSIAAAARAAGVNLRVLDPDHLAVACDETTVVEHLERVWAAVAGPDRAELTVGLAERLLGGPAAPADEVIPPGLVRASEYLTHPVFHQYRSETEMLRYLRRLQAKDIALDRSMIPLGSCTMKLNATTEMLPITWPQFGALHPYVPMDQAAGYQRLFADLQQWLCELTGYDAVSLQPNAGSQGEYAGLLCIRAYHRSRGEGHRNVCLIPSSAHGTNPASAHLAGLKVVVVACDDDGNIDVASLRARAEEHAGALAALMVTYPSTHGVFEESIAEVCDIVHEFGGQVYLDGANLNAMVGISRPAELGADVSHLNLHKTFCIPHGGGGPGMGPIGVRAHLAPFLPAHPLADAGPGAGTDNPAADRVATGAVSAAAWGSASILPISWAYIAMMGIDGLRRATEVAILNANYVARRLEDHFPILYRGSKGRVAHECIIDLRGIKAACAIIVDDVAKRLVDFGFHAPTMSFPVPDTMMIEPTESESLVELDRFCDAMITIRGEIAEIERGSADPEDNLLRNAPHTPDLLMGDWNRPYSKERAFFPHQASRVDKYWPPAGRIDNAYGDRNLQCACPPLEVYEDAAD